MKNGKKLFILLILLIGLLYSNNVYAFQCDAFGDNVNIDDQLAHITHYIILILQIVTPIILVIFGSIDLAKGITSQKEDEIKKGQQVFIKRLISGALVFLVIAIVKLLIGLAASGSGNNIFDCVNTFVKGPDSSST